MYFIIFFLISPVLRLFILLQLLQHTRDAVESSDTHGSRRALSQPAPGQRTTRPNTLERRVSLISLIDMQFSGYLNDMQFSGYLTDMQFSG